MNHLRGACITRFAGSKSAESASSSSKNGDTKGEPARPPHDEITPMTGTELSPQKTPTFLCEPLEDRLRASFSVLPAVALLRASLTGVTHLEGSEPDTTGHKKERWFWVRVAGLRFYLKEDQPGIDVYKRVEGRDTKLERNRNTTWVIRTPSEENLNSRDDNENGKDEKISRMFR
ncbi:hypothetical protein H920_17992 [Fukomys damarensis]|uniref:Uncharacterized protein n=1 Tax=Fukomys damarensis TaxID=885580 RepID=A0A091DCS8_FUKDA|nr:hypothetical protein H920_17992 [Fukomys damarensis]